MASARIQHLQNFYSTLALLEKKVGGARRLANCSGRLDWPTRGVYFFMESGEERTDTGTDKRIVRVGTHALTAGADTRLWTRLSQHRGQLPGGGNHRGSIFRLIVGRSVIEKRAYEFPTWGVGSTAGREIRLGEVALENEVSAIIGEMPFLWIGVEDEPGAGSLRGYIERNAIALLSNFNKQACDAPSEGWLGHHCNRDRVRKSGLWNSNHVDEAYDPAFLTCLKQQVSEMEPAA